ncbi:MAG: DEAD/DEAH box helicase [Sandaracinaceae bacterium]
MSEPENETVTESPTFDSFDLDPRIIERVAAIGFKAPTPIQAAAMKPLLEGRDIIGQARTGSGKTAAFGLPMLSRLAEGGRKPRALVLAPTRELALQITAALRDFAKDLPLRMVTVYGGVSYGPQIAALDRGVPLVIGTPGRLLDHIGRGRLDLSEIEMVVVDEADEMLRMGFIDDVETMLAATPETRQVALFSATMPPPIKKIADKHLKDPVHVAVESQALSTGHIEQRWMLVPERNKGDALVRLLASETRGATLVFCRTRAGCAEAAAGLAKRGLKVDALHGDLAQSARELVLTRLRAEHLEVVVATDVAARGIDVEHLTHVVNMDLPNDPESYVHRIGRTGRAGAKGVAISFVTPREVPRIRSFQRSLKVEMERMEAPSDADVDAAQRERLIDALSVEAESMHMEVAERLLSGERSAAELLGSALKCLADAKGVRLRADADSAPPSWARASARQDKGKQRPMQRGPANADEVEVFIPMGKQRGLRPKDLVGALTNELGVPINQIGRITIVARACFLRVPREIGEHLLSDVRTVELRGVSVPFVESRNKGGAPPPRPQKRPFRKGGFNKSKFKKGRR